VKCVVFVFQQLIQLTRLRTSGRNQVQWYVDQTQFVESLAPYHHCYCNIESFIEYYLNHLTQPAFSGVHIIFYLYLTALESNTVVQVVKNFQGRFGNIKHSVIKSTHHNCQIVTSTIHTIKTTLFHNSDLTLTNNQ
jgi:hypothetical protein